MKNRTVLVCAAFLSVLGVLALVAPVLAPSGPFRTSPARLQGPSALALMGTDDLGRNIAIGVLYGARTSLLVAFGVGLLSAVIALPVGALAGYAGGVVDDVLMRLAELTWVLPRFFLAIGTAALFGARVGALIVLLGLVSWPGPARILRSSVVSQRDLEYADASRSIGARPSRVLVSHVLPNSVAAFVVSITVLAGNAILIEAGLAFLGLGDAANPSWGSMLRDAQPIMQEAPWAVAFPAVAVTAAVLAFNLLGDGLLEAWSPRQAGRTRS